MNFRARKGIDLSGALAVAGGGCLVGHLKCRGTTETTNSLMWTKLPLLLKLMPFWLALALWTAKLLWPDWPSVLGGMLAISQTRRSEQRGVSARNPRLVEGDWFAPVGR